MYYLDFITTLETCPKEAQAEIRVLFSLLSAQMEGGKTSFPNLFLAEIYLACFFLLLASSLLWGKCF